MAPLEIDLHALTALCRKLNLDLAILYGSQASGLTHPESDLDLGILRYGNVIPSKDYLDLYHAFAEILPPVELDLVDLGRVPGLLKHLACERGLVLYESEPGIFARFRVLAWNLYQDERIQIRCHDARAIQVALRSLAAC